MPLENKAGLLTLYLLSLILTTFLIRLLLPSQLCILVGTFFFSSYSELKGEVNFYRY